MARQKYFRAVSILNDSAGSGGTLFAENFFGKSGNGLDANLFIEDLGAFGLQLDLAFCQGAELAIVNLGTMVEDHDGLPVDDMHGGVSMAIEIEGIPLAGRFFIIPGLDAVAAGAGIGAERIELALPVIDIVCILFYGGDVGRGAGATPVVAGVGLFHLEFLAAHPGAAIGSVGSDGMIEQAAVLLLSFFRAPGEGAPFEEQLEVIVPVFLFGGDATGDLAGDADAFLVVFGCDGEYLLGRGIQADAFEIDVPIVQVLPIEEGGPTFVEVWRGGHERGRPRERGGDRQEDQQVVALHDLKVVKNGEGGV